MDGIRQKRPNESLMLNIQKRQYRQSLDKTFDKDFEISMVFKTLKK